MKKKAEDILCWRNFLTGMNEARFFDIMRLYVGEIKTPYNKQKLIEALSAFLHKEENRHVLFSLLSKEDLIFIAAVIHIPCCSQEKALSFFGSQFSFAFLHDRFLNLEERLILYRRTNEDSGVYFDVNPLLREELEKKAVKELLFLPYDFPPDTSLKAANINEKQTHKGMHDNAKDAYFVSSRLLASWAAFAAEFPEYCRLDGSFKKKAAFYINERFAGIPESVLTSLHTALFNLSLFRQNGNRFETDKQKLLSFACLPALNRYAYLAAAFCGYFRRDILQRNAALTAQLLRMLSKDENMPSVSRVYILRLIFLLQQSRNYCNVHTEGRLRSLFRENLGASFCDTGFKAELLFEAFVRFGILLPDKDKTASVEAAGEGFYFVNPAVFFEPTEKEAAQALSIDAGFSVTVLKDLPLDAFFDLTSCMELEICDTVSRFHITRAACLRAFENGISAERIIGLLQKYASHELPQNLLFSLHDWYAFYASGSLFKGYVLQVSEEKRVQTEKNPVLAPYIRTHLAPGVYLLDFTSDEEAADIIKKSGLEFIGAVKEQHCKSETLPFVPLEERAASADFSLCSETASRILREAASFAQFEKNHINTMENELKKKHLSKEQEEELRLRIRRKTVLSAKQLRENSVRVEKNEASGLDFLGKIRVIETALAASDFVDISCGEKSFRGVPIALEKKAGDAALVLTVEGCAEPKKISVAQARFVKRIRSSVFGAPQ